MILSYAVQVLQDGQWTHWDVYLSKRLAEGVRLRCEQEGHTARVQPLAVDWDPPKEER